MSALGFLFLLGFKTTILSVAVVIAWFFLKILRCRSPKMHRTTWAAVLLLGLIGAGLPVSIPVKQPVILSQQNIAVSPTTAASLPMETSPLPEPTALPVEASTTPVPLPEHTEFVISNEAQRREKSHPPREAAADSFVQAGFLAPLEMTKESNFRPLLVPTLCGLWLAGIAGFLLWRFSRYLLLLRRLKTANVVTGDAAEQWNQLCTESNIRPNRLPLLLTDHLGPGLVWRPSGSAVLVPRDLWEETTSEIREGILRHELAHYRNCDMIRSGVARLLALVHWFNPLAWFALKKMDEATEWVCDLAAFGTMTDGTLGFEKIERKGAER